MNVVGIVAEYNPFHNGHLYHIQKAKEITNSDYCIVVMSGNYTQRGLPAMMDKYTRTKIALLNGADLVLELPVRFATSSAEDFAQNAVALLNATGIVNSICFGSECGSIDKLSQIAEVLLEEPDEYKEALRQALRQGCSYPVARNTALQGLSCWDFDSLKLLSMSNNILGIEYLKALKVLKSNIKPYTLQRRGSDYNDGTLSELYSSAMAIRASIATTGNLKNIISEIPSDTYHILQEEYHVTFPIIPNDFSDMLHYKLLQEQNNGFSEYLDINADLSDRIVKNIYSYKEFDSFCDLLKTKNMTYTRISRSLMHILLDLKSKPGAKASYLRILGFNKNASDITKTMKTSATLPIISKLADAKDLLSDTALDLLNEEVFATNLYESVVSKKFNRNFVSEYQKQIQILQ